MEWNWKICCAPSTTTMMPATEAVTAAGAEIAASSVTLAPATSADQMEQVVFNSTLNGTLQALFALLVIVVVANAFVIWLRALRAGGLPTTEVPWQESHLVAPADFFATAEEKEAVAQYGSTDSGASLGDILGAALKKSRQDD